MSLLSLVGLLKMVESEHTAHAGVHLRAEHRTEQTATLLQGRANVRQPVHNAGFLIEVAANGRVAERAVVVGFKWPTGDCIKFQSPSKFLSVTTLNIT